MSLENPYQVNSGAENPTGQIQLPPPNYLVWAILSTIFCCLPFGIASIVFSAQVNAKYAVGDFAGAQESSAKAKKWAIIALVVGVVFYIIYALWIFAFGGWTYYQSITTQRSY